jgi:hypothetical protein
LLSSAWIVHPSHPIDPRQSPFGRSHKQRETALFRLVTLFPGFR